MRISAVAALMILTTVLLSACAQDNVAQLEDKSHQYYGRKAMAMMVAQPTYQSASVDSISAAPLSVPQQTHYTGTGTPFGRPTPPAGAKPVAYSAPQAVAYTPAPAPAPTAMAAPVQPVALTSSHLQWPVEGRVTEKFGKQANGIANEGITIAAAEGTPIKAADAGEVAYVGNNVRDYGNMVILRHPDGAFTSYAHAKQIIVSKGDRVMPGEVIGYVGQTGSVHSPQLHFALREGDHAVDPLAKLPSQLASR
jgi:murein DD-endopeptidase MepM/ murein hydrolase activator NlpD